MWQPSERETAELRETVECPPEATVYRNGKLMALLYREAEANEQHPRWHLYVSCQTRPPLMAEVLDARAALLPDIDDFAITPEPTLRHTVHVWELVDTPPHIHHGRYLS